MTDWGYHSWQPANPANWGDARHDHPTEHDCHVDLGCGTIKKGRIGVDLRPARGVNVVMDLDKGDVFAQSPEPKGVPCRWRLPIRVVPTGRVAGR